MNPLVQWQNVSKLYRREVETVVGLAPTDLEIARGELVGVRGPSGSGKSTLLQLLGFIEKPTTGSIKFAGSTVDYEREEALRELRARQVGFVFQYFNLLSGLTALENVVLTVLLSGGERPHAEERARVLLGAVGLQHRLTHFPHELSGGEMQRVAVARALAHQPVLLLADEPTGNLDSHHGAGIVDLLVQAHSTGTTCVIASHNDDVLGRCGRVLHLKDGQLADSGAKSS